MRASGTCTGTLVSSSSRSTPAHSDWIRRSFGSSPRLPVAGFATSATSIHYAASFIFEPMGYALGNLFTDFESFDPPSTPAMEVRVVPIHNFYVKSMVLAAVPAPFSSKLDRPGSAVQRNSSQCFRDWVYSWEKGFVRAGFRQRRESKGIFRPISVRRFLQSGNVYVAGECDTAVGQLPLVLDGEPGSLARWTPKEAKGIDATFAYDWSPPSVNRNNTLLTAGLRFNEPLPLRIHNTMSLGYVRNSLSTDFLPPGRSSWKTEQGIEFNALLDPLAMLLLQPVIQYYANVGGGTNRAVVFGFRTKVEF